MIADRPSRAGKGVLLMGVFSDASESHARDLVACQDSALLHDVVLACVDRGWLLSFGSSRDGGAVSVRVTNDDGKDGVWCGTVEELERALRAVLTAAGGTYRDDVPVEGSNGPPAATGTSGGKAAGRGRSSKTGA